MKVTVLPEFHLNDWDGDKEPRLVPFYKGKRKLPALIINNLFCYLSFLIPFICYVTLFIYFKFAPFGQKSFVLFDGLSTNLSFINELNRMLHSGHIQLYSLAGKASEIYSSIAFYACSPCTLLSFLMPQKYSLSVLSFFSILRVSLGGFFAFQFFVSKSADPKLGKYDASSLFFSLLYSLSSYGLFHFSEFQYFDHFMLFPFFLIAVDKIRSKKANRLFLIVSVICILSQFYMGLMMLIFGMLYQALFTDRNNPDRFHILLNQFLYSLLACALSGITLIPGIYGLATIQSRCPDFAFTTDFFHFLLLHLPLHDPSYSSIDYGGINPYAGCIVLIFVLLHFCDTEIPFKARLKDFLVTLLLFFALCQKQFQHFSLFGHSPNSTWLPLTFLYVFWVLILFFNTFSHIRKISVWRVLISSGVPSVMTLASLKLSKATPSFISARVAVACLLTYATLIILYRIGSIKRRSFRLLIFSIATVELLANAGNSARIISLEDASDDNTLVLLSDSAEDISGLRSEVLNNLAGDIFFPATYNSRFTSNPFLNASSVYENKIGYSPLDDSMAAINALYIPTLSGETQIPNKTQYQKSLLSQETSADYTEYINTCSFPFFYLTNLSAEDIEHYRSKSTDMICDINASASILGAENELFTPTNLVFDYSASDPSHISITLIGESTYQINQSILEQTDTPDLKAQKTTFVFTPEQSGDLYLYLNKLVHFGDVEAGQTYKWNYYLPLANLDTQNLVFSIQGFYYQNSSLQKLATRLNRHSIQPSKRNVWGVEFTIPESANNNSYNHLMTAIPYRSNLPFTFYADGKKLSPYSIHSFLCIPFPKHTNTITVSVNKCPLILGLLLTLLSGFLCLLFLHSSRFVRLSERNTADLICKKIHSFNRICYDNRIYLLGFLIPFCLFYIFLLINSCAPFGSNTYFNGDAPNLWIPEQYAYSYLLKSGIPMHTFYGGGGYNTLQHNAALLLQIGYMLFSPKHYIAVMTFLVAFRIGLSSLTTIWYLSHRIIGRRADKHDIRLFIPAFSYSMSSFIILMSDYWKWMPAFAFLPLILWGMDLLMIEKKKRYYILFLSLSFFVNYYPTMFICFYLVIRFFFYRFDSFRDFVVKSVRFALSSLTVGLLNIYTLFFAFSFINTSSYSTDDAAFPDSHFFNDVFYYFRRFGFLRNSEIISWNEGDAILYIGMASVLLLLLYILTKRIPIKEKIQALLPLTILYLTLNQSVLSFLFNGLHYQHGVPNRFVFIIVFLTVTTSYDALTVLTEETPVTVILAGLIPATGIFFSYSIATNDERQLISSIFSPLLLIAYSIIMLIIIHFKKHKQLLINLLVFSTLIELSINAAHLIHLNRNSADLVTYESDDMIFMKEHYSIDSILDRICAISPVNQGYPAVNQVRTTSMTLGGAITDYQLQMSKYLGQYSYSNYIMPKSTLTPMGNALAANRYILLFNYSQLSSVTDMPLYQPCGKTENCLIYENDHAFPFGYYMPDSMLEHHNAPESIFSFWQGYADYYTPGKKLIDIQPLAPYDSTIIGQTNYYQYGKRIHDDEPYPCEISVTSPATGMLYVYNDIFIHLGDVLESDTIRYKFNATESGSSSEPTAPTAMIFHSDVFESIRREIEKYALKITSFDEEHLEGDINLPDDGYITLSMPYDNHWTAYVDGNPTEIRPLAGAFLSIKAPKGNHHITLSYSDNSWLLPLILCIAFWSIFIVVCIWKNKEHSTADLS